jgi:hypothetical protein
VVKVPLARDKKQWSVIDALAKWEQTDWPCKRDNMRTGPRKQHEEHERCGYKVNIMLIFVDVNKSI